MAPATCINSDYINYHSSVIQMLLKSTEMTSNSKAITDKKRGKTKNYTNSIDRECRLMQTRTEQNNDQT